MIRGLLSSSHNVLNALSYLFLRAAAGSRAPITPGNASIEYVTELSPPVQPSWRLHTDDRKDTVTAHVDYHLLAPFNYPLYHVKYRIRMTENERVEAIY